MRVRLSILFLSSFFVFDSGCKSGSVITSKEDCTNKRFQDSLIVKYVDSGASKLPYMYNNPAWTFYLDSVLAICPNVAAAYQLEAVPAIKNGDYMKAYALDEKAAAIDPQQYVSYLGFLKCIFTKDYSGAIGEFNKANRIIPGGAEMDHSFYFYLGICFLQLRNYHEAEKNFNTDIFSQNKGDSSISIHFNSLLYMGITKSENNQLDSARIYFDQCLHIYEKLPEANYYLALVYKKMKETKLEIKYLKIAQEGIAEGYSMNEDNLFYVNYPYQITLFEIRQQLSAADDASTN